MANIQSTPVSKWPQYGHVFSSTGNPQPSYEPAVQLVRKIMALKYGHEATPQFVSMASWLPNLQALVQRYGKSDCFALVDWIRSSPKMKWWRGQPFASCKDSHNLLRSFLKNHDRLHTLWLEEMGIRSL